MPNLLATLFRQRCAALILGALAVFGYAPFYLYPIPILTLAGLFLLLAKTETPRRGFALGWFYGLGLFGAGVSWIYVSLHDFGGMPMPLAALATGAFCAFLALFPALAGWLGARFSRHRLWALPFAWVLFEWVLNWIFTGFPWMTLGYSQVPHSGLAGWAPVAGVFGVSLAAALTAALTAALIAAWARGAQRGKLLLAALAIWLGGSALKFASWSVPVGQPISVSLLQGNIPQDMKWRAEDVDRTLRIYLDLARKNPAQLVVLPETALPLLWHDVPQNYRELLAAPAKNLGGNTLAGAPEQVGDDYFNSMFSLGTAPEQKYSKSHLVPFGEFIPFKSALGWVYRDLLHIPLSDLSPGATDQQPMMLAGQQVALNICYEDVFGEEIIRQLPQATLLVNASNDAWYGHSLAAHQHLQISQTRALETARMMLRATNTGATAIIAPDGTIIAQAPHFTTTALTGQAQGYAGITPYVRWGNWPVVAMIFLALGLLWWRQKIPQTGVRNGVDYPAVFRLVF
ncbi:MAG: apolipoprotein N-acyltransferase [Methylobacillus sp.]|jgi:apolipoprotein N-acyltransferase|nr:apolipoprotein N-acyltransferase [Methylobacillus sp.]